MKVESTGMAVKSDVDEAALIAALVERVRAGDPSAFEALYRRFARSVHSVLLARVSGARCRVILTISRSNILIGSGPWHSIAMPSEFSRW